MGAIALTNVGALIASARRTKASNSSLFFTVKSPGIEFHRNRNTSRVISKAETMDESGLR